MPQSTGKKIRLRAGLVLPILRKRLRPLKYSSVAMKTLTVREARLRPEFADRYPGVEPGVWFTAATLAEHLDFRRSRDTGEPLPNGPRPLVPEHFEFRGGEKPLGLSAVLGRRPGD
jgi:hypothetical protein